MDYVVSSGAPPIRKCIHTSPALVWDLDQYWINSKCSEKALTRKIKERVCVGGLIVLVLDNSIRPIRGPLRREAGMQADNEMSGGGMASGGGGRPPSVIIITISKWAKPPAGSQQERLYFYLC